MRRFVFVFLLYTLAEQGSCDSQASSIPLTPPAKKPYPYGRQNSQIQSVEPPTECPEGPASFRFNLTHRECGGIGYNEGYTSLDGFFLFNYMETWHPFFDVRAHIFNDGRPAANLGFGIRYVPNFAAVLGINGFFDYRNTKYTTFEQVGVGLEVLGTQWEFRANGYFPIFGNNNFYSLDFYQFQGHHAIFRANHEITFKGFDLLLGRSIIERKYMTLSSTLGGYMRFADYNSRAIGGLIKLQSNLTPFFSLETQGSYDSFFKGIAQVQASVNIPFGKRVKTGRKKLSCQKELLLSRRLAEAVDRFEIIVADHHPIDSVARDIRTGKPLHIIFVDNRNTGGNGTAESPYGFLKSAEKHSSPWDMIYVYAGDGSENRLNTGIVLQNNQWLQSAFLPFPSQTAFGLSIVPAQSKTRPIITNATSSAVALANNNTVAGFTLHSNTSNISGSFITDAQIIGNRLSISANYDIFLSDVSGTIVIQDNVSTGASGLYLHTGTDTRLVLNRNDFANRGSFNLDVAFTGSSHNTLIMTEHNECHDSLSGSLIVTHDTSELAANISGNQFTALPDGTPYCLKIFTTDLSSAVAVIENNLFRSSAPGLHLDTDLGGVASWYVTGNKGLYTGHFSPMFPYSFTTGGLSTATLLLARNFAAVDGYTLTNSSAFATFKAESPDGAITGLEALNIGTFTTSGTITYIPFNPGSIPVIE